MKADVKRRWVAALRSGAYRQTFRQLVGDDGCSFCAVGVLADLYAREVHGCSLPALRMPNVVDRLVPWAELSLDDLSPQRGWWNLVICANDSGESFSKIATMIEMAGSPSISLAAPREAVSLALPSSP